MYVPPRDKVDEVNRERKSIREAAPSEFRGEVNKARGEMSQQQAHRAGVERLTWLDFRDYSRAESRLEELTSRARAFIQKYITGYGEPLHRLSLNKEAWNVGHVIGAAFVTREYLGGQGYLKARKEGVSQPMSFAPGKHAQSLGAWYPYDHEYHHLIPCAALRSALLRGAKSVPFERRVSTIWESKWNMHNPQNIVLLPDNPIVARVVGLPPHCPWGAKAEGSPHLAS